MAALMVSGLGGSEASGLFRVPGSLGNPENPEHPEQRSPPGTKPERNPERHKQPQTRIAIGFYWKTNRAPYGKPGTNPERNPENTNPERTRNDPENEVKK